jgi:hypothetical protein
MKKLEIQQLLDEKEELMAKVEAIEYENTLIEKRISELNQKQNELVKTRGNYCKRVKEINGLIKPKPVETIVTKEKLQGTIDNFKVKDYFKPVEGWTGEGARTLVTFKGLTKKQLEQLITKFIAKKRQQNRIELDKQFLEKLPEDKKYKFSLFEYTRLTFYADGSGIGHPDDLLYNGGSNGKEYNSHTIHWRRIPGKIPFCIKFSISIYKS